MDVGDQLRQATRHSHQEIERTPLAQQIAAGVIQPETYGELMSQLLHVHMALEAAWKKHADLVRLYPLDSFSRIDDLRQDLDDLQSNLAAPRPPTVQLQSAIDRWSRELPIALVGPMYVLEGSRLGSQLLLEPLSTALGSRCRLRYHANTPESWRKAWRSFKSGLDSLASTPQEVSALVDAANQTFRLLGEIYAGPGDPRSD